jgi:hypothetical protein
MFELNLPDWKENRVADGKWHRLYVELRNWVRMMHKKGLIMPLDFLYFD